MESANGTPYQLANPDHDHGFMPTISHEIERGVRPRNAPDETFQELYNLVNVQDPPKQVSTSVRMKDPISSGVDAFGRNYEIYSWPKFTDEPRKSKLAMINRPRENCILYQDEGFIVEIYTNVTGVDQQLDADDHFAFSSTSYPDTGMRFYLGSFQVLEELSHTPEYITNYLFLNGNNNILAVLPEGYNEKKLLMHRKCLFKECSNPKCFESSDKVTLGDSCYCLPSGRSKAKHKGACSECYCRHYHCGNIYPYRDIVCINKKYCKGDAQKMERQLAFLDVGNAISKKRTNRKSARSGAVSHM